MVLRIFFLVSCALVTLPGCYGLTSHVNEFISTEMRGAYKQSRELDKAPFAMPQEFPVPPDAIAISRPLKGTSIHFETTLSVSQTQEFYRRVLIPMGLYENTLLTHNNKESGQIVFNGWPGGCGLVISILDLAYSSSNDKRNVVAKFEWCR